MQFDMNRQIAGMAKAEGVKRCCLEQENLYIHEQAADRVVLKCKECGCRHFRVKCDPLKLGAKT